MIEVKKLANASSAMSFRTIALCSAASAPLFLSAVATPALADIVNDAVVTGVPDSGTLSDALASESVGVALPIVAAPDRATSSNGGAGVANIINVFDNDDMAGAPASPANTTITVAPGSSVPEQLAFDPSTGSVGITPKTPAGTYSFEYQLCETVNPDSNRSDAAIVWVG